MNSFQARSSASVRDCVGWLVGRLVGPLVRPSVPTMQLRGKLVTSRLLREEEEEEENWLCCYSFAPRDQVIPLFYYLFTIGIITKPDVKGKTTSTTSNAPKNMKRSQTRNRSNRCDCTCFSKILNARDKNVQASIDSAVTSKVAKLLSILISHSDQ